MTWAGVVSTALLLLLDFEIDGRFSDRGASRVLKIDADRLTLLPTLAYHE